MSRGRECCHHLKSNNQLRNGYQQRNLITIPCKFHRDHIGCAITCTTQVTFLLHSNQKKSPQNSQLLATITCERIPRSVTWIWFMIRWNILRQSIGIHHHILPRSVNVSGILKTWLQVTWTALPLKKVIPISIGFSNMGYCSSSRMECHEKLIRFLQSISFHFPEWLSEEKGGTMSMECLKPAHGSDVCLFVYLCSTMRTMRALSET